MKEIMCKKILNESYIVLLTFVMIVPMAAATANDQTLEFMRTGAEGTADHQQTNMFDADWIHFDDGTTVDSIGLNVGGTFEFAIRITPAELVGYEDCELTVVRWHHGFESAPPHSGTIKIYDAGTSTSPGVLITSEPFTVPSEGWFEISLSNPVPIDPATDIWVSIQITHAIGEHPAGVGPGPVVAGKGGWISSDGVTWEQLGIDITSLDYNWNIWAKVESASEPPAKPQQPQGPTEGIVDVVYTFSTSTIDPEDDQVSYQWDWDDGTLLEWTDYSDSGMITYANHTWTKAGTYEIRVKAKDPNGYESDWSDSQVMTVIVASNPILEIESITGGLFKIRVGIKNTGSVNATGVNWSISLVGGFILSGAETSGRMGSIPTGTEETVSSSFILGFGKTIVTVHAETVGSSDTREQEAFVFLFILR